MLKEPYLVFMDIDGTLSTDHLHVSKETCKSITRWQKQGVIFYIASGRPRTLAKPIASQINNDVLLVSSNGAVYQDNKDQWVINFLTEQDLRKSYYQIKKNNLKAYFFGLNDIYYTDKVPEFVLNYGKEYLMKDSFYPINFHFVNNFNDLKRVVHDSITNGIIVFDDLILMNDVKEYLFNNTDIHISSSNRGHVELIPKNVDKSTAIKQLQNLYKIDYKHTIVFGDGKNDIGMFKQADISVAMDNAIPELKKIAKYITDSNLDDGVAHFLNKFFASI